MSSLVSGKLSKTFLTSCHQLLSKPISGRFASTMQKMDPIQEALLEEECILVDSMDQRIGRATKKTCHLVDPKTGKSPLHRAFSLFVFNNDSELLLQQRSDAKITFPGMWTNTCCSHPLATPSESITAREAEGVRRAAQRRIQAELGVSADDCPIESISYLTRILYSAPSDGTWGENEIDYILVLKSEKEIQLRPNWNEVKNLKYISRDELSDFVQKVKDDGPGITPWFEFIAKSLLPKWWSNLANIEEFKNHHDITRFL